MQISIEFASCASEFMLVTQGLPQGSDGVKAGVPGRQAVSEGPRETGPMAEGANLENDTEKRDLRRGLRG